MLSIQARIALEGPHTVNIGPLVRLGALFCQVFRVFASSVSGAALRRPLGEALKYSALPAQGTRPRRFHASKRLKLKEPEDADVVSRSRLSLIFRQDGR